MVLNEYDDDDDDHVDVDVDVDLDDHHNPENIGYHVHHQSDDHNGLFHWQYYKPYKQMAMTRDFFLTTWPTN